MPKPPHFVLGAGALLFLGAIGVQMRSMLREEVYPRSAPLVDLIPRTIDGWTVRDTPVADTPEVERAVREWLDYDEALQRCYHRLGAEVIVYVAYWKPGKIHPRLIAQHTPDICWPGSGWVMGPDKGMESLRTQDGRLSQPGRRCVFSVPGRQAYVIYWHLVGGEPSAYARGLDYKSVRIENTLWEDLRRGQREQYFIRISSNVPFVEEQVAPLLSKLITALAEIGLVADPARPRKASVGLSSSEPGGLAGNFR